MLLLAGAPLFAHDLYLRPMPFQPKPGEAIRVEYHNGHGFPMSEVPTNIQRLRGGELLSKDGRIPLANFRIEGTATVADVPAPISSGCFWIVSRTEPNFIELAPDKFEGYLNEKGLEWVVERRKRDGKSMKPGREIYSKHVKALGYVGNPTCDESKPLGFALEIVPLANPYTVPTVNALPVRVLLHGKVQAGLAIEISHAHNGDISEKPAVRTNGKGEALIPVGPGLWKLHVIAMEPRDGNEADWESFWTSLSYEIPNR